MARKKSTSKKSSAAKPSHWKKGHSSAAKSGYWEARNDGKSHKQAFAAGRRAGNAHGKKS